ncbi:MAG: deoxyribonuclease IV [Phycisphaerales bacterium]|nr:deoxyribonuclease IV [Phycisphaerales bacterium]
MAKRKSASRESTTKQRFGSHMSVAGGLENAFDDAVRVGCDCLQIFVKNQKQWTAKPLTDEAIDKYKAAEAQTGIGPVVAHSSYLINLGSPKAEQFQKSVDALTDELERCEALGVGGLVLHPGAHMGEGVDAGIKRIADGIDQAHKRTAGFNARILLESTAGQGTAIGHDIKQLGAILESIQAPERVGICLDTCHLFAAGYDLRDEGEYDKMVAELKKHVGLKRVECIHTNDSKGECGSHLDRHEHIGKGKIGLAGFRNLLNDKRLAHAIRILETPKGVDGRNADYDKINLGKLRRLLK